MKFKLAEWGDGRGPESGADWAILVPGVPVEVYEALRKRRVNTRIRNLVEWKVSHGDFVYKGDVVAEFNVHPIPSRHNEDRGKNIRPVVTTDRDGRISIGTDEFAEWPPVLWEFRRPDLSRHASRLPYHEKEQLMDTFYCDPRNVLFAVQPELRDAHRTATYGLNELFKEVVRYCYSLHSVDDLPRNLVAQLEMLANEPVYKVQLSGQS